MSFYISKFSESSSEFSFYIKAEFGVWYLLVFQSVAEFQVSFSDIFSKRGYQSSDVLFLPDHLNVTEPGIFIFPPLVSRTELGTTKSLSLKQKTAYLC